MHGGHWLVPGAEASPNVKRQPLTYGGKTSRKISEHGRRSVDRDEMHVTYLSLPSREYLSLNNQSRCVDADCSILLYGDIDHDEGHEKRMDSPTDG